MNDLDRMIEESLRRRANVLPAVPAGYGDVTRRMVRRRRRAASMATAAVTLPALAAAGWVVARPEPIGSSLGSSGDGLLPEFTTSTSPGATQYRCTGEVGSDGQWMYFQYCESTGFDVAATPTSFVTLPPPTSAVVDAAALADHVLFVDGTHGKGEYRQTLADHGLVPRFELPSTRLEARTMVMATGADVELAYQMLDLLGLDGLDSWTPEVIGGTMPDGISAVVVVGTDWSQVAELAQLGQLNCLATAATDAPATASTGAVEPVNDAPAGTPPAPTTTWLLC